MSGNERTVGGTASSGSPTDFSKGKTANGKCILGKIEELGELVYVFNRKDQADKYLHATEAIANYVGVEYGRNMRMLVKNGDEKKFAKPIARRKEELTSGLMAEFIAELDIYHHEKRQYEEQKSEVFVIILGQCTSCWWH